MKRALVIACLASACAPPPPPEAPAPVKEVDNSPIGIFMRTRMNPSFSRLSFLLTSSPPESVTDLGPDVDELLASAVELHGWADPPVETEQGKQVFYEYAAGMRNDITKLQAAVQANQHPEAVTLFAAVGKKCDSCHHFFRYGQ